jgi:colicin import membrane protein
VPATRSVARCQERYGIDVDAPGADGTAVAVVIAEAERNRADAAAERAKAGEELTASQLLFAQADRHEREHNDAHSTVGDVLAGELDGYDAVAVPADGERVSDAAQEKGSHLYDSSERRRGFASELEAKGISEKTIAARMLADGENAKHPREAVTSSAGKATKIRSRGATAVQQRDRGGLSR